MAQIAASLNREMVDQPYRQAVLATDTIDLMAQLAKADAPHIVPNSGSPKPPVIFMFPGIGDHYGNMARGLYTNLPLFQEIFAQCDASLLAVSAHITH